LPTGHLDSAPEWRETDLGATPALPPSKKNGPPEGTPLILLVAGVHNLSWQHRKIKRLKRSSASA
jgi:hypothetical protein